MPRAKKNAETTAEVKEIKAAPAVEKKAAPAEEKKPAAKKTTTAKKTASTAKKPAAKKAAAPKKTAEKKTEERKVVIQYEGGEVAGTELIDKAKADAGIKTAKSVVVYVRPEINKVYYVIDDNTFGNFDLF